eukprot:CAMPEP_0177775256 /NCGR_PEP_ID=MMETSP0491_2-20121128/13991_1 /TAXON_ID=63592 /ORGANISM="Tetraselmis chuii, Strain PLY429" /LENGTH=171 /DNA_ID=CAMNT_0019293785 /DNA_START=145 /DNA_END=656 /DNA_ORIENTATION=-
MGVKHRGQGAAAAEFGAAVHERMLEDGGEREEVAASGDLRRHEGLESDRAHRRLCSPQHIHLHHIFPRDHAVRICGIAPHITSFCDGEPEVGLQKHLPVVRVDGSGAALPLLPLPRNRPWWGAEVEQMIGVHSTTRLGGRAQQVQRCCALVLLAALTTLVRFLSRRTPPTA